MKMKKVLCMLLALIMVLPLCACGEKDNNSGGSDSEPSGKLVIYSPNSDTQVEVSLTNGFMKKYPKIDVELQSMGTGDVLARIEAEKENPQCDVNWGAINFNFYHQHPDLWEAYTSPNESKLDPGYRNNTGYVTYCNLSGSGAFILNNGKLRELGVDPASIKGYADLLNPKLKGQIAMGDPTASSSAFAELTNMLLVMGKGATAKECYESEEGWKYVKDFVANLDGIILSSSSAVYKNVINGETAIGVSYEDPVIQAIIDNKDNPDNDLSMVYPEEGAVWLPAGVAIVKNAPNMENAKLFIDYLLSDEAQTALAATTIRGTNTSIPSTNPAVKSFSEIKIAYEDQQAVSDLQEMMKTKWMDIVTG